MRGFLAAGRAIVAVLAIACGVVSSGARGAADEPPPIDARAVCPATVAQFAAADADVTTVNQGPARVFGLVIRTRDHLPPSSYRVILANDERVYGIALPLAIDTPDRAGGGFASAPVYVRFAHPTVIHDAWIGAVEAGDAPRICGPNNVYSDRAPIRKPAAGPLDRNRWAAALVAGAANATVVDVPEADAEPAVAPTCAVPEAQAGMLGYAAVRKPSIGDVSGIAEVEISLDEESRVAATRIFASQVGPTANAEAIRVARASSYRTTVYRCHPIPADFIFVVRFQ